MSETVKQAPENKMGTMPVNRLLLSMSLPMIVAMLVQALYNIVDSIFVAQLSENALTAVSLAFPVQNLMIAVGAGTGVGVNALLSRSLGENNRPLANRAASTSLFLAFLNFLVFAVLGTGLAGVFFRAQTDIAEIAEGGTTYLVICCLASFGIFYQFAFERLLQSTGRTFYSMITQCLGAVINIILDPILIFGLLGFPKLGIAGAAIATVFGQCCAAVLGLIMNLKMNPDIQLRVKEIWPQKKVLARIYSVGIPSIMMGSIGSIMTFGVNRILIAFTPTATAVFGVYFKLQSFVFMPVFGLNNGLVPIVAYNYGARKASRMIKAIKDSILYAVGMMFVGMLAFWLLTKQLLLWFNASENMLAIGVPALRIISLCFVFAGFSIIGLSVCQALGHGFMSLVVSVVRQLVVLLPAAWVLAQLGGLNAVWYAFPLAELVALVLSLIFVRRVFRLDIRPLEHEEKQAAQSAGAAAPTPAAKP